MSVEIFLPTDYFKRRQRHLLLNASSPPMQQHQAARRTAPGYSRLLGPIYTADIATQRDNASQRNSSIDEGGCGFPCRGLWQHDWLISISCSTPSYRVLSRRNRNTSLHCGWQHVLSLIAHRLLAGEQFLYWYLGYHCLSTNRQVMIIVSGHNHTVCTAHSNVHDILTYGQICDGLFLLLSTHC